MSGLDDAVDNPNGPRKADTAILIAVGGGIITLGIAIWLAFAAEAETLIEVDEDAGSVVLTGPEAEFTGTYEANVEGNRLFVSGLPMAEEVAADPRARRAVCKGRDAPGGTWTEPSAQLRSHLHSPEFDQICEIYDTV